MRNQNLLTEERPAGAREEVGLNCLRHRLYLYMARLAADDFSGIGLPARLPRYD